MFKEIVYPHGSNGVIGPHPRSDFLPSRLRPIYLQCNKRRVEGFSPKALQSFVSLQYCFGRDRRKRREKEGFISNYA